LKQEILIIEPGSFAKRFWHDLWSYRELFFVLAWRDISVRYKQTIIGVLWAFLRPFLTMVVFTIVFGRLAGLPSEAGAPYALLVFAGLLPWSLFSTSLSDAGNSLIGNSNLISKVYFPRLIIPAAAIVTSLVDFLVSFAILAGLMVWYMYVPGWQLLLLPLFTMMAALAAFGAGLYLSSMTAKYRDFRYIIPFALQLGLYVSPVGFSTNIVPERWRMIFDLNPLVGIIDGFRWCILRGQNEFNWQSILISAVVITFLLWLGIRQFRSNESTFADVI
jgi:lipopolysaccharide transport system permease protein